RKMVFFFIADLLLLEHVLWRVRRNWRGLGLASIYPSGAPFWLIRRHLRRARARPDTVPRSANPSRLAGWQSRAGFRSGNLPGYSARRARRAARCALPRNA